MEIFSASKIVAKEQKKSSGSQHLPPPLSLENKTDEATRSKLPEVVVALSSDLRQQLAELRKLRNGWYGKNQGKAYNKAHIENAECLLRSIGGASIPLPDSVGPGDYDGNTIDLMWTLKNNDSVSCGFNADSTITPSAKICDQDFDYPQQVDEFLLHLRNYISK